MLRAADVIAAVATSLNLPVAEVTQLARYLRERDLFIRETKSPRSWQVEPRDAAALFAAVLTGAPAVRIAEAVQQLRDFADADEVNAEVLAIGFLPTSFQVYFSSSDNLLDALTALLTMFQEANDVSLCDIVGGYVEFETTATTGIICFRVTSSQIILAAPPVCSEFILNFGPGEIGEHDPILTETRRIDFRAFRQVGKVLARA